MGGIVRPTREGATTPLRRGLINIGVGVNPGTPDEDPEPPTDWAASSNQGQAFVPYLNASTPALVQSKTGYSAGGVTIKTVTLDSTPTVGNILVLAASVDDDGGPAFSLTNGPWTQIGSTVYSGNGTNWPNRLYYQVVSGSTSASTTVDSSGGSTDTGTVKVAILELSGVDTLDADVPSASNTSTTQDSATPTAGQAAIGISAVFVRNAGTGVLTPVAGSTELAEIGTTRVLGINYRLITSTSGAYTLGSTGAAANSSMIGAIFRDTGDSINWIDAPLAIDGNDATFEYVAQPHSPFLRHTLDDAYIIDSARLLVAWTSNTSRTLTLQGANEADYSDAVTLDSHTYSPTGSLTADDLDLAWTGTTVYRYYQYLTTVENWYRVYESSLFQPAEVTAADIITDHGGLTGLTDDDHPQYELTTEGGQALVEAHGNLGTTETVDPTSGNVHTGTLNANCTITLNPPPATRNGSPSASVVEVRLTEDGTGGWTPTFAASGGTIAWVGGTTPTHTTTLNTLTVYLFETVDGGTTWLGMQVGSGSSLTVKDEGTPLATAATSLDFVGSGVVASGTTADKTITISGAPTGAAGGDLSGTYPNPSVVDDSHTHSAATAPGKGELILDSAHATPFTFGEILQESDGSDFLYSSA